MKWLAFLPHSPLESSLNSSFTLPCRTQPVHVCAHVFLIVLLIANSFWLKGFFVWLVGFGLFRAAYGRSQARGWIGAAAAGLCHSHGNTDLSHICDLHHSSWKCRILNPLNEARDWACVFMDTSQVCFQRATMGTTASPLLGLRLRHMDIPRPGVESELQLPVYTTATATWDLSCICDLHHSSQQCCVGSLIHWWRPGTEPASSWTPVGL